MHIIPRHLLASLLVIATSFSFSACRSKEKVESNDAAFSTYIEAYTSGVISKKNTLRVVLASDASVTHTLNEEVKEKLFDVSPSVKGKTYWTDARTIEFKPLEDLKPNTAYTITFRLGAVMNVPGKYKDFSFTVQTIKPAFEVENNGLRTNSKDVMTLTGKLSTADVETSENVEKVLQANLNGNNLKIVWAHNEAGKTHDFIINDIKRTNNAQTLTLQWNGDAIGANKKDEEKVEVPAIGDFKVLDVKAVQEQEQYALVQFSDPVASSQMLEGLINMSNTEGTSFTISGSEVKIYSSKNLDGNYSVTINEGIENAWGDKLDKKFAANIFFENRLPSVKIQGRGVILPNSGGKIVLPFTAVNLKAVDVSVIRIYETNIAQFLQVNSLSGEEDLRRVAKPLAQATLRLDDDKSLDLHKNNRFSLDLDKYIKTEPGALYRVFIAFRPDYSVYSCDSMKVSATDDDDYDEYYGSDDNYSVDENQDFWSRYQDYYPYGYNWQQRNNPCSKSYYNKERFAGRNILSTNIGLTAKRGSNNTLFIAVNNIINTEPMSDVRLRILDYQQQEIASAVSSLDGVATVELKRKPFLLVAEKDNQKSYLKLDDGSSLPLGRFDVDGEEIKNGIKAFVFGERGVWRPGDSLFLSCVVDDIDNKLPKDHPIEMELITPRGQLYKRMVQTNANNGFNVFRTATDSEAPTGNWVCKVKIGGASYERKIKIETVMPNRLKINLKFDTEALGKDANANGTLSAKWLFGAPAQSLKARVDAQLYKRKTAFPALKNYVFDDPTSSFSPQSKTIFDGTLSNEGEAVVNPSFTINNKAPGQLLANLTVKVFEPGGAFSIDNISMPYNPYPTYAGIKVPEGDKTWGFLLAGKTHRFEIADVDTKGNLVSGSSALEVQLYKIQWRWWWDNSGDNLSNFTQDEYNKLIKKEDVTITNGKGYYDINIDEDNWGRYLVLVKDKRSGHTTGSTFYVDDYGWQSRNDNDDPSAAAMLSFTSDKAKYNVGEEVKLTIPSSKGGRALISIETGSKVLQTFWVESQQGQTKFAFKVTKEMTPNIYVNVSLLQPHAQTVNDLPIRMYGVIPVAVEDKNTLLKPVIKMADAIQPEVNNSITVSEANGKSMTYVIAIVDEGLLDLTHYKTPDPHDAFFAREALGVKSFDLYDYVIGAWGSEMERILTIGGDAEAELAAKTRKANRFKPVVQFLGPFTSNGSAKTHQFILPPYMGSVRAMVIAAGDNAYGVAEKAVAVKKPLMLLATLPRVLAPTEEIKIPVTVFATQDNIKNVSLTLQANPFIEATGTQSISFTQPGEQTTYFNARVKANTGVGKVMITASSGNEKASSTTEIDIRNPNPFTTQTSETTLQPNQTWSSSVAMIGDASTSKAVVELSVIPSMNLEQRLSFLIQYPHGCIEQTVSSVYPQLVLNQLTDLNDKQKAAIDQNIKSAIQKIQNFQTQDGGFSYWPNEASSDEWGSNYAGNFLLEASARGYIVPASILQQWKQYEKQKAQAWNVTTAPWYGTDLSQSYRLYLLALAKVPELGAMNRLKEFKFLTPEAKWRLAAAYQLIGQSQVALQLISGLPTSFSERKYAGFTFGSELRDQAMVLETLTLMNRRNDAAQLVRTIAAKLSQDNWYSTQTTAFALLAIAKYSGNTKQDQKITATLTINNKTSNINTNTTVSQTDASWQNGKAIVQLKNNSANVLYVTIINQGKPLSNEALTVKNDPAVLQVNVSYISRTGQVIDPASIKQGTDFVAKVSVTNPGNRGTYTQMALSEVFPSGWEILNTRLYNSEGAYQSSSSDYMDIRDDRVNYYFDIKPRQTLTYYVQLNAAYPGKFIWPGVYCEAMYDNKISGGVSGKRVEVVE